MKIGEKMTIYNTNLYIKKSIIYNTLFFIVNNKILWY